MKIYRKLVVLGITVILFSSCNSWLELNPKDQVNDDHLFGDYRGFRNALNGIYKNISSEDLYGRNMSWGFLSLLTQTYDLNNSGWTDYFAASEYDYKNSDVKPVISVIWTKSYSVIANCNKLLEEIEGRDTTFFPLGRPEKDLIEGEARAVRAFLHFDLLRLFAPAPIVDDGGNYIPYFEVFGSKYEKKLPVSSVLEKVIKDLLLAKDLVAKYDTITNYSGLSRASFRLDGSLAATGGAFFKFRGTRMNLVAIYGLLARVYMYAGEYQKAKESASYVYNTFVIKKKWYSFTRSGNISTSDPYKYIKMYDDILLAFYDRNLIEHIDRFKKSQGSNFSLSEDEGVELYAQLGDRGDLRAKLITTAGGKEYSQRWMDTESQDQYVKAQYKIIPVLRMSEIYYILSECYYRDKDYSNAEKILKEIRTARGLTRVVSGNLDESLFMNELEWEYKKEFLTEGQSFFVFKRLNTPILSGARKIEMGSKFVLPTPDNENIH